MACGGRRYPAAVNLIPTRWYTMLVMPSTLSMVLMAAGLFLLLRQLRKPQVDRAGTRRAASLALVGLALLYTSSTPLVATLLARSLEVQTEVLLPEEAPQADAIVVLGGGQQGHLTESGKAWPFTHHAGDRLETGLRAFQLGRAPLLVLGGGTLDLPGQPLVGDYLRSQAEARGVPADRIVTVGAARYTTDESMQMAQLMHDRGVKRVLLCTSASHMPRARLIMERLGFGVTPMPCDFDTRGAAERFSPLLLVPRGGALSLTENCLKEWLGLGAVRLAWRP